MMNKKAVKQARFLCTSNPGVVGGVFPVGRFVKALFLALIFCSSSLNAATPYYIVTVAGFGPVGYGGDGISATAASLSGPAGVAVDKNGNIFIADKDNHRIRKVDGTTGLISTMAGTGVPGWNWDNMQGSTTLLWSPTSVCVDNNGIVYFADSGNNLIRKIDGSGNVIRVAGDGTAMTPYSNCVVPTATSMGYVDGIALSNKVPGGLYISDNSNHTIRESNLATLCDVAGSQGSAGFGGDGFIALPGPPWTNQPYLNAPRGVVADAAGTVFYFADAGNNRIRKVTLGTGIISTVAGSSTAMAFSGDDGPALNATLGYPSSCAVDAAGNIFISDYGNGRIRKIDAIGIITTIAGSGQMVFNGDRILAKTANIGLPRGITIDGSGKIYFADADNNRIRMLKQPPGIPDQPGVSGSLVVDSTVTFRTASTDPHGDRVKFGWDWDGDGTVDEWAGGFVGSGLTFNVDHKWTRTGTYTVKVQAVDSYGILSEWSVIRAVTIVSAPSASATTTSSATASDSEKALEKIKIREVIVAPNSIDPTKPGSKVVFNYKGDPGSSVEVKIFTSSGTYIGSLKGMVGSGGAGSIFLVDAKIEGKPLATGFYWAQISGAGINDRKQFAVFSRKGK